MSARKSTRSWSRALIECLNPLVYLDGSLPRDADFNRDAVVNALDFGTLATNFGQSNRTFEQGDSNRDGTINTLDFNAVAANFNERVEMAAFRWLHTVDGNLGNHLNYLGSPAGVPGAADSLTIDDSDVGFLGPPTSNTGTPITALASLTINDQSLDDFSGLFNSVTISGAQSLNGISGITVGGSGGNIAGSSNVGTLTFLSLTGSGKQLAISSDAIVIDSLAATADYTVTSTFGGLLQFNAGVLGGIVRFTSTSGVQGATVDNWHAKTVSNKTGGVALSVGFSSGTLAADATLESQLAGVTVTDGSGGTFQNYTKPATLSASGTVGGSGTATTPSEQKNTGFVPTQATIDPANNAWNVSLTVSGSIVTMNFSPVDTPGTYTIWLIDGPNSITLTDTITVTAAATGGARRSSPQLASRLAYLLN